MRIMEFTRRQFLKTGCVACGAVLVGLRWTGKAVAAAKTLKDYMTDRLQSVYNADVIFKYRASQDNPQVIKLYQTWLEKPNSHKAHQFLHMHFTDRSKGVKRLMAEGKYPNPRSKEFEGNTYPYE
jgi:ferredoxin hydrogenase small subunit